MHSTKKRCSTCALHAHRRTISCSTCSRYSAHPDRRGPMRHLYRALTVLGSYRAQRVMGIATLAGLAATVVLGLFVVPPDAAQGDVQRLMYVHVPAAWVMFLAFGVTFIASAAYLKTGRIQWDRVAAA